MAHENTATRQGPDGWWYNFPTVVGGKQLSEDSAWELANKRRGFFGVFKDLDSAKAGAELRSANTPERERPGLFQRLLNSIKARGDLAETDLYQRIRETAQARQDLFDREIAIPGQHVLQTVLPDATTGFKGREANPFATMGLDPRVMVSTDNMISTNEGDIVGGYFSPNRPLFRDTLYPLYEELLGERGRGLVAQGRGPMVYTDTGSAAHEAQHRGLDLLKEIAPEARMPIRTEDSLVHSLSDDPEEVRVGYRLYGAPDFELRARLSRRARDLLSRAGIR